MYFMYVNMKGIEVWQLLLLETALDIHEKELKIQETTSDYKMWIILIKLVVSPSIKKF